MPFNTSRVEHQDNNPAVIELIHRLDEQMTARYNQGEYSRGQHCITFVFKQLSPADSNTLLFHLDLIKAGLERLYLTPSHGWVKINMYYSKTTSLLNIDLWNTAV